MDGAPGLALATAVPLARAARARIAVLQVVVSAATSMAQDETDTAPLTLDHAGTRG